MTRRRRTAGWVLALLAVAVGAGAAFIQDAGHSISLDQPDLYLSAIRAFLLDRPLPAAPYADAQPPVATRS